MAAKRKKKTPAKRPRGGQTKRTKAIEDAVLRHLAAGLTLRSWCMANHLDRQTIANWAKADEVFARQLAHAKELGAAEIEDEILEIADTGNDDDVQHRKLRIYAREKRLVWNDPAKYGHKTQVDKTITHQVAEMTELERATRVRQLLEKAGAKVVDVEVEIGDEVEPEEEDKSDD